MQLNRIGRELESILAIIDQQPSSKAIDFAVLNIETYKLRETRRNLFIRHFPRVIRSRFKT